MNVLTNLRIYVDFTTALPINGVRINNLCYHDLAEADRGIRNVRIYVTRMGSCHWIRTSDPKQQSLHHVWRSGAGQ